MRIENDSSSNKYPWLDIPSHSSDNSSNQSDNEDSNSSKVTLGCADNCTNTCYNKRLNVLTKNDEEKTLLIYLISKISDPQLKTQYMNKLKDLLTKETKESKIIKNKEKPIFSLN